MNPGLGNITDIIKNTIIHDFSFDKKPNKYTDGWKSYQSDRNLRSNKPE